MNGKRLTAVIALAMGLVSSSDAWAWPPEPLDVSFMDVGPAVVLPGSTVTFKLGMSPQEPAYCAYGCYLYGVAYIVGSDGYYDLPDAMGYMCSQYMCQIDGMVLETIAPDPGAGDMPLVPVDYYAQALMLASYISCMDGCNPMVIHHFQGEASPIQTVTAPDPCPSLENIDEATDFIQAVPAASDYETTLAAYLMTLTGLPSSAFARREVRELFNTAGADTCWFPDSDLAQQLAPLPGQWTIGVTIGQTLPPNVWAFDSVGWKEKKPPAAADKRPISYYRSNTPGGFSRCGTTWYQTMEIQCNDGTWGAYRNNVLHAYIDVSSVDAARDSVSSGAITY